MESEGTVRLAQAFCSARDRNVPVLRRERTAHAETSEDLPQFVACLDYGVRCTGWLCPLFTLPTLPPEELLAEAVEAERNRKRRTVAEGRAILERAVREGGARRKHDPRPSAPRNRSRKQAADVPEPDPPSDSPPAS